MKNGQRLRALLEEDKILIMPNIHDGYSARLVKRSGFPAAMIGGAGLTEARLGWADRGLMGLRENVDACRDIAGCVPDLPVIADGDTGYGNAVNVHFTVRAFEGSGVTGVLIEDQTWPKRCGHMQGKGVIDREEAVEKIRAASDARTDPDFLITGRTDSAGTHDIGEAITRLNLFAEAGADILFADALLTAEDISTVARETSKPLIVNMGFGLRSRRTTPLIAPKVLEDMGVAAVVYPRLLTAAAVQGMQNAMAVFLSEVVNGSGTADRPDLLASFDDLNELTGMAALDEMEDRYSVEPGRARVPSVRAS